MKEFSFSRRGQRQSILLVDVFRIVGGERVPLVYDSIPTEAFFPVVFIIGRNVNRARARAEDFISKNPSFSGGVLYEDDGSLSCGDSATLLLVNLPEVGMVDEPRVMKAKAAKTAKQLAEREEQLRKSIIAGLSGRWLLNALRDDKHPFVLLIDLVVGCSTGTISWNTLRSEERKVVIQLTALNQKLGKAYIALYYGSPELQEELRKNFLAVKEEVIMAAAEISSNIKTKES